MEKPERVEKMTIDDESSIHIGGLPYDATQDTLRTVFDLYGAIVDIKEIDMQLRGRAKFTYQFSRSEWFYILYKIISDQRTRCKCYGFVTFTNPRFAVDAINDMNGRALGGRLVKVSGVRTRGGKSHLGRQHFPHNVDQNGDWDRSRGRDRDYNHDRDKDGYRNRNGDWSRERDRSRDREQDIDRRYERIQDHDPPRESLLDKYQRREGDRVYNGKEYNTAHVQNVGRDYHLDLDTERKMDRTSDLDRSFDNDRNEQSSRNNGVSQLEERLGERRHLIPDLQKQSSKLEDALVNAKKHSSYC